MITSQDLVSWKRGTRTSGTVMIMSKGFKAGNGHHDDENAHDHVRGLRELEKGH